VMTAAGSTAVCAVSRLRARCCCPLPPHLPLPS